MRKLMFSINMTLDGFCDHNAVIADDELHEHFNELFRSVDTAIFGRKTYQLMENSWPALVKNPSGDKAMNEFAILIDTISKIVFSNTLKSVEWNNTILAKKSPAEVVLKLKQQPGKNILVGGRTLMMELLNQGMIDEFQLCIHPIILGKGVTLFKDINERINLKLLSIKTLGSGVTVLTYQPLQNIS